MKPPVLAAEPMPPSIISSRPPSSTECSQLFRHCPPQINLPSAIGRAATRGLLYIHLYRPRLPTISTPNIFGLRSAHQTRVSFSRVRIGQSWLVRREYAKSSEPFYRRDYRLPASRRVNHSRRPPPLRGSRSHRS